MQKNDTVTVTIEDLGYQGEGIARYGSLTIFVPFALVGEKVRAKILSVKKNIAFAKLEEVLTPAEERVRPECPVFRKCGGCQLQHLRYTYQLRLKTNIVKSCLKKVARIEPEVGMTVKSENVYGYRNKLQIPVGRIQGRNAIGFYAPNSHRIVECESCALQPQWSEKIIRVVRAFMDRYDLKGYDENNGSGDIRHIVVREISGKLLITLVINGTFFSLREELSEAFRKQFDQFGLYINFNNKDTNVILGEVYQHVSGFQLIDASSHGMKYQIHPASFYQVNDNVREKIYSKVVAAVLQEKCDAVIDAYSGAGILTAILTKSGCECFGIEIVPEATRNAEYIKNANCLFDNMHNINGDCAEELPKLVRSLKERGKRTAVVLDPPRKGCDMKVLEAIRQCGVPSVIYVSCSPATLARDVGVLLGTVNPDGSPRRTEEIDFENLEYSVELVQPYDMFALTKNIETVVVLRRTEAAGERAL